VAGVAVGRGGDGAERAGEAETVRERFETIPLVLLSMVGPDCRVVAANAALRAFLGRDDVIRFTIHELMPEYEGQQMLDQVRRRGRPRARRRPGRGCSGPRGPARPGAGHGAGDPGGSCAALRIPAGSSTSATIRLGWMPSCSATACWLRPGSAAMARNQAALGRGQPQRTDPFGEPAGGYEPHWELRVRDGEPQ